MNKIVCYIAVLFLLMLGFGASALAAEPQDVSSLFYLQGKMPSILPFILLYMLAFSLVALFLANAFFSWQKVKHSIELLEAFMVDKLYRTEEISAISPVAHREFKSGLLESELIIGGKVINHRGVYLLECNPAGRIELAALHLMENIAGKWNRPLLYMGRTEQGIMKGLMKESEIQDQELSNFEKYLSPYLFLLPALLPDPEKVLKAAGKMKKNSNLGAIVIEDLNCCSVTNEYLQKSMIERFAEISQSLRLPVFIVYPGGRTRSFSNIASDMEKYGELLSTGEIRVKKDNEIYTIS